jgi:aminomethyltransferase
LLDAEHRALGARMAEFGGWDMPLQYAGVLEEHRACRDRAVVFDVSHLGSVWTRGPGAFDVLQWAFTNDLRRITPGHAQYTHLLDPDDAHVVDDIIVWWLRDDEFIVMPNASNTQPLVDALLDATRATEACTVEDVTGGRVVLAVQGPKARDLLAEVAPDAAATPRFAVRPFEWEGAAGWVAGTGYTGEDGVELHVPADAAVSCWRALLAAGVQPAGLAARDTLRLEMGFRLHGHELGAGITPYQAGLAWVVRPDKGEFRGHAALLREQKAGVARRLRGLLLDGRQVPRAGYQVLRDGETLGEITSGNFSPTLERGIALAFLRPDVSDGEVVAIDVRGRPARAVVVKPPFVHR